MDGVPTTHLQDNFSYLISPVPRRQFSRSKQIFKPLQDRILWVNSDLFPWFAYKNVFYICPNALYRCIIEKHKGNLKHPPPQEKVCWSQTNFKK